VDIEQVMQPEQDIKSEQEIQPEIHPLSLLNSPDVIKNLPPCEAIRHDLSTNIQVQVDTSQITILSNWSPAAINKWGNRTQFQSTFGNYPQYIKGKDVQPLTDKNGDQCKARTTTLIDTMLKLSTTTNTAQKNEMDLLFFTNNKEHPSFLEALSSDYSIPSPIESYLHSRMAMDFKYSQQWKKDHHIHSIHMMLHGLDIYQVLAFGTFYLQIRQSL